VSIKESSINGTSNPNTGLGIGLVIDGRAGGTVSNVDVSRVALDGNDFGAGVLATGGTVDSVELSQLLVSNSTNTGIGLASADGGTLRNLAGSELLINGSSDGLTLNASSGTISDSRIERADLGSTEGNENAGVGILGGGASNYANVTITETLIRNNSQGVRVNSSVSSDLARSDIDVSYNFITDNGVGIRNDNPGTTFDARLNYWGATNGPSSATSGDLKDPVFDALADGDGDSVSEGQTGSGPDDQWPGDGLRRHLSLEPVGAAAAVDE